MLGVGRGMWGASLSSQAAGNSMHPPPKGARVTPLSQQSSSSAQ